MKLSFKSFTKQHLDCSEEWLDEFINKTEFLLTLSFKFSKSKIP